VAEDMGTWPPEQATVLLEVLSEAGLTPEAKRTREGVLVTVPDEQSDEAHRQLVANMDRIASAARQPKGQGGRGRRPRPVKGADHTQPKDPQQLASERLQKIARPIGLVLIALLILVTLGPRNPLVAFAVLGVLIYVIGKRAQQQGGGSGGSGPLR
jgi:hypothetical protein